MDHSAGGTQKPKGILGCTATATADMTKWFAAVKRLRTAGVQRIDYHFKRADNLFGEAGGGMNPGLPIFIDGCQYSTGKGDCADHPIQKVDLADTTAIVPSTVHCYVPASQD